MVNRNETLQLPGDSTNDLVERPPTEETAISQLRGLSTLGLRPFPVQGTADMAAAARAFVGGVASGDLEALFPGDTNAAVEWGVNSGGLVNVSLPAEESRRLAANLPDTGLVFGPDGAPDANRVYLLEERIKTPITFRDTTIAGGPILAELRGDGTCDLVPPSKTPDGKDIRFLKFEGPARARLHDLLDATSRISAATLIVRHLRADEHIEVGMGLRRYLRELGINKEKTLGICRLVAAAVGGVVGEEIFAQAESCDVTPTDGGNQLARCVGGREVVNLFRDFLTMGVTPPISEAAGPGGSRRKQVDDVLALVGDLELFHTPQGEAYASLPVEGETHAIGRGGTLGRLLQTRYYGMFGSAAAPTSISTAIDTLEAMAFLDNAPCIPVYTRVAGNGDKVYVDLTNPRWEVIEIDQEGWRVLKKSPIKFRRSPAVLPLPIPAPGGTLDELKALLNTDDEAWRAIAGFIVGCYNPRGPYFVLQIHGEQGSAKTTAARIIKNVVDPQVPATRCLPRDDRDLAIAAKNTHVLSFDNLSRLNYRHSDAICRLSTGGGLTTRTLYTNDGETVFDTKRPVILNGIEDFATRGDLLDRSLIAYLKSIPDALRLSEEDLDSRFREAHPRILGALCDAVSSALRNMASISPKELPRMADAAKFVTAAEPVLGWESGTFITAMVEDRRYVRELELEAVPIARFVVDYMTASDKASWSGTATDLYAELRRVWGDREDLYFERDIPRDPVKIGNQLRRIAPALREKGLEVITGKRFGKRRTRIIEISKIGGSKPRSLSTPTLPLNYQPIEWLSAKVNASELQEAPAAAAGNPIATTAAVSAETAASSVVPSVPDDLEITEEVKQKRRTRKAA